MVVNRYLLFVGLFVLFSVNVSAWYDSSYVYRTKFNITEMNDSTLTNFEVNITIDTENLISIGKLNSNCSDLLLVDENDSVIDFWYADSSCGSNVTDLWVRLNLSANSSFYGYFYYGKENGCSDMSSDGSSIFTFFDDFEQDSSNWLNDSVSATFDFSSSYYESGSYSAHVVTQDIATSRYNLYRDYVNKSDDVIFEYYSYDVSKGGASGGLSGIMVTDNTVTCTNSNNCAAVIWSNRNEYSNNGYNLYGVYYASGGAIVATSTDVFREDSGTSWVRLGVRPTDSGADIFVNGNLTNSVGSFSKADIDYVVLRSESTYNDGRDDYYDAFLVRQFVDVWPSIIFSSEERSPVNISTFYNASVFETENASFNLNISGYIFDANASFVWNNNTYVVNKSGSGSEYQFNSSLVVGLFDVNATNVSFDWNFNVTTYAEDIMFYAIYNSSIDGDFSDDNGNLSGVAAGGASVSNDFLNLSGGTIKHVKYDAVDNVDFVQTGAVEYHFIPDYSGIPAATQYVFSISDGVTLNNLIELTHVSGTGQLVLNIFDSAGSSIISYSLGVWSPTFGVEYVFELNMDISSGATRLFVDGGQFGITLTSTGSRSDSVDTFLVGNSRYEGGTSDFNINQLVVYDTVQHTSNYTVSDGVGLVVESYNLSKVQVVNWAYFISSLSYPSLVIEGDVASFVADVDYVFEPADSWYLNLSWNGTVYEMIALNSSSFSKGLNVPEISENESVVVDHNVSFYVVWNSSNSTSLNSTRVYEGNTSIYRVIFTNCSVDSISQTESVSFFIKDESSEAGLDDSSVDIWLWGSFDNYSFSFDDVDSNFSVCIWPVGSSVIFDSDLEYGNVGYGLRSYYLVNYNFTNVSDNITLYLLNSNLSSSVVFSVIDANQNSLARVYLSILKWIDGTSSYGEVAVIKTNGEGEATSDVILNNYYKFFVEDDSGSVYSLVDPNKVQVVASPHIVKTLLGESSEYWDVEGSFYFNCTTNDSSNVTICGFTDASGSFVEACLNVSSTSWNVSNIISSECVETSTGTISYSYDSGVYTTYSWLFYTVYRDVSIVRDSGFFNGIISPVYDDWALMLVFIFVLAGAGAGVMLNSPSISILLASFIFSLCGVLGLVAMSSGWIIGGFILGIVGALVVSK